MSNQYVGKKLYHFSIFIGFVVKSENMPHGILVELTYAQVGNTEKTILLVPHEEMLAGDYHFEG